MPSKEIQVEKSSMGMQFKIRNLTDDLHKKIVKWLCVNHRMVLLPSFETSQMLRKGQGRIGSKTARAMAAWSHYRFKMSILHLSQENIHGASQSYVMNISQARHVDNVALSMISLLVSKHSSVHNVPIYSGLRHQYAARNILYKNFP
jgi:hypothetical protein